MKTKQDQCAHVARYYADLSEMMAAPSVTLFGCPEIFLPSVGINYPEIPPNPTAAVAYLKTSIAYIRIAIRFWLRAGGEVKA